MQFFSVYRIWIWGYGICFSVILVHLENHAPWSNASLAALSSIGTIQLGLMFFLTYFINNAFRRYPEHARKALWISAAIYPLSLLLSSFATQVSRIARKHAFHSRSDLHLSQVWQLILTQGVLCGLAGAILYGPVVRPAFSVCGTSFCLMIHIRRAAPLDAGLVRREAWHGEWYHLQRNWVSGCIEHGLRTLH